MAGKRWAALAATILLGGCALREAPILAPPGPVLHTTAELFVVATLLMLIVVLPVLVLTAWFAWRYRASRRAADYAPELAGSTRIEFFIWAAPVAIVLTLGVLVWHYTHKLDPYLPLGPQPYVVEAIGLDWKWLFLYPEDGVASVGTLAFPADRPLELRITTDTVMNSLMIPALGGQIYAMAGMETRLNLKADRPGVYAGRNYQFSGNGFPAQRFDAHALDAAGWQAWLAGAKAAGALDRAGYLALAKPGVLASPQLYSAYPATLFDAIVGQYRDPAMCRPLSLAAGASRVRTTGR